MGGGCRWERAGGDGCGAGALQTVFDDQKARISPQKSLFALGKLWGSHREVPGDGTEVSKAQPGLGTGVSVGSHAAPQQTFLVWLPNAKHSENAPNTNACLVRDGSDYTQGTGGSRPTHGFAGKHPADRARAPDHVHCKVCFNPRLSLLKSPRKTESERGAELNAKLAGDAASWQVSHEGGHLWQAPGGTPMGALPSAPLGMMETCFGRHQSKSSSPELLFSTLHRVPVPRSPGHTHACPCHTAVSQCRWGQPPARSLPYPRAGAVPAFLPSPEQFFADPINLERKAPLHTQSLLLGKLLSALPGKVKQGCRAGQRPVPVPPPRCCPVGCSQPPSAARTCSCGADPETKPTHAAVPIPVPASLQRGF